MTDIAELGYKVDSSGLVEGTRALDENAAAADKAGAAAERLEKSQKDTGKSASFWAGEQQKINARVQEMERIEQRTAAATKQAAMATEARELNLQKLLGQINPTVAALNRLAEQEDRLARARDLGLLKPQVWQQYQANIDSARASILNATGAQNGMGMSARQLQNNLRMIPMQVTDITTSLISGQPAWMVAIQQGGQLKDQFGGIGPAARAVGGYVLGLINPVTLAGAALAAMAISAKQADDQLFDFQKAQILSGQATSIGAAGFLELASSIDRLQGVSRGGAVAALTETARAGRYAGEQFEMVAAAAARMEASAGRSAKETVRAFDSIAKEPVEGLLKLNDAERFLTATQLQRITALHDEGRSQEAANEAIQIYATHLDDVANRTEAVMPAMSKGWRDIKDDIGGAWGALGNFTSAVVDLAGEWGVLARLPRLSDVLGLGLAGGTLVKNLGLPSFTEALNGAAAAMRGLPPLPKPIDEGGALDPQAARDMAAQPEATRQWNRRLEMYDKQLRIGAEVEKIEADGIAAGRTRAEIEATIANYKKSQEESAKRIRGSSGTKASQEERDALELQRAYDGINAQLSRQVSLYGDRTRLAQTTYDLERGNLKGLSREMADALLAQAARLDALDRQKEALSGLARLQAELNKEDKTGLAVAQERLKVLNEAKGEGVISDGDYDATLAKIVSAGSQAPKITGVDALYGGSAGELAKLEQQRMALEEWYSGQLEKLSAFRQAEASLNAVYDQQALADRQAYMDGMDQIDRARQNVMLAAAEQGFASVTDLMRTSFSEQSTLYKAAFIVQKAAAIAQATLAIQTGIAEAAKNPWPANLAAMASVAAATAGLVSNIAAVGMAHDGIDSVPTEGTWLLNKGERVLTAGTAAKMDATLDRIAASGAVSGNGGSTYAPTIYVAGDPDRRTLQALKALLDEREPLIIKRSSQRTGAELAAGTGYAGKGMKAGFNAPRRVR